LVIVVDSISFQLPISQLPISGLDQPKGHWSMSELFARSFSQRSCPKVCRLSLRGACWWWLWLCLGAGCCAAESGALEVGLFSCGGSGSARRGS